MAEIKIEAGHGCDGYECPELGTIKLSLDRAFAKNVESRKFILKYRCSQVYSKYKKGKTPNSS